MGGRGVRVFHISDLHMRSVDGPQRDRARLEAAARWRVLGKPWEDNLTELRRDGVPFDLVVFTGDLADWGHPTDYPHAVAFLKQTCATLSVPLDRLFVVPGNHDIDRTLQRAAWESLRRDIATDPRGYSRWMAGEDRGALRDDGRRNQILERQRAFWGAVAVELERPHLVPWHSPHGRLGYRQAVTLPGLAQPIHVIGLDTTWLAGDDRDGGTLRLTEHQVALLTTTDGGAPLPGFRLALMHHRLADLADASDSRRQLADRVDLLLHGHQHQPAADILQGPDHQLVVLATGCLYEGDEDHRYANTGLFYSCAVSELVLTGAPARSHHLIQPTRSHTGATSCDCACPVSELPELADNVVAGHHVHDQAGFPTVGCHIDAEIAVPSPHPRPQLRDTWHRHRRPPRVTGPVAQRLKYLGPGLDGAVEVHTGVAEFVDDEGAAADRRNERPALRDRAVAGHLHDGYVGRASVHGLQAHAGADAPDGLKRHCEAIDEVGEVIRVGSSLRLDDGCPAGQTCANRQCSRRQNGRSLTMIHCNLPVHGVCPSYCVVRCKVIVATGARPGIGICYPNFGDDVPILVAHPPPPLPKPRRRHAAAIAVSVMSPKKAKLGVFQHVTATYDGATARLYVDGLEVNSFQAAGAIPPGPGPLSAGTTARSTARCSRRTR